MIQGIVIFLVFGGIYVLLRLIGSDDEAFDTAEDGSPWSIL